MTGAGETAESLKAPTARRAGRRRDAPGVREAPVACGESDAMTARVALFRAREDAMASAARLRRLGFSVVLPSRDRNPASAGRARAIAL